MTTVTTPYWGDIADDFVKRTFVEKQGVLSVAITAAMVGEPVDSAQIAKNFNDQAKGFYLLSHYLESVEDVATPSTKLANDLGSLRANIHSAADWHEKATILQTFVEKSPSLMHGFFEHDFKEATSQLGAKFGHIIPEFVSKLSVTASIASTPLRVVADYKDAAVLVKPFVDNHTLTAEAGSDYADVVTRVKLMQAATMNLEPSTGYPLFKEWADKHHLSHDDQLLLDPTSVSKSVVELAPEA